MSQYLEDAAPENYVAELAEFLRFVSDNFAEVSPYSVGLEVSFLPVLMSDGDAAGPTAIEVQAMLEALVQENRAVGRHEAELFFLNARAHPFINPDPIFANRATHRRAAELGMLTDPAAEAALVGIALNLRSLSDENRHDDAVQAGEDTLEELDAAGIRISNWTFLTTFGEALALAGQGERSDEAFSRAFSFLEGLDENSDFEPFTLRRMLNGRLQDMQFVANQWAYYLNIQGRFADAEEPAEYAATWAEKLKGRDSISTQKARYNYAVALLGQGKAAEALPYFEEALPLQRAEEKSNGWRTGASKAKDTVLLLTTLARARVQVAGREADALAAAIEAADNVRDLREERLNGGNTSAAADPGAAALAKAVARGERRDPLSPAYDMVLQTGWVAGRGSAANLDAAFRAAQDLTLNEAGSAISQAAARDLAGTGPLGELVRSRQDTASAIVRLDGEYREASVGSDAERLAVLRADLQRLGGELAAIDARLEGEFPEYGELVSPRSVEVARVQGALGEDEALIMLLPSEGDQYVFALTREFARWHRVEGGSGEAEALVATLKCRMDEATCSEDGQFDILKAEGGTAPQPADAYYPRYDLAAAYRLYELLLAPVADAIAGKRVVYTVSAGPVSGLPLAALVTAPPAGTDANSGDPEVLRNAPWLGMRHSFVTLPAVSAITLPRRTEQRAGNAFVGYGAPVLLGSGDGAERGAGTGPRRRGGAAPLRAASFFVDDTAEPKVDPEKLRRLNPLPGTERELSMLARSLVGGEAGLRLGPAATEAAVKGDAALASAGVVVFATHGLLPGEMGQAVEPGLVMTPPTTANALDDGLLTAREAAELSLSAQWVILSACNTATPGRETGGEALSSLARAFLYAGAESLLASHWRVSDDASAQLTVQTIRAAQSGMTRAEALSAGQDAVRSGVGFDGAAISEWAPHWAHPAAWAPFTLITDHNR